MMELIKSAADNIVFVLQSLAVVVCLFAVAYIFEKLAKKKNGEKERILATRKIAAIGMLSAIAMVLMLFEIPLPMIAPPFYALDFSEVPVLIGSYAYGPCAGVLIEFCKIVLKLLFKPTSTAFVGELANFAVGCSFILPASIIYMFKKNKKTAIIGSAVGTLSMTVFGTAFNAIYLLPTLAAINGWPLENVIAMGTEINPMITNIVNFVVFAVAPLNLIKGTSVSCITILVYKKLSVVLKPQSSHGAKA